MDVDDTHQFTATLCLVTLFLKTYTCKTGYVPIRIKLSATNLGQLLADNVARIRKAVQIRYLLPNQLPGREAFSLLLEQPF
jgi:hypothetical protein